MNLQEVSINLDDFENLNDLKKYCERHLKWSHNLRDRLKNKLNKNQTDEADYRAAFAEIVLLSDILDIINKIDV